MTLVKKYLGLLWLALAALCAWFGIVDFGLPKLATGKTDDLVFGVIILFILMPIIVGGLIRFGLYAWQGLYEKE